MLYTGKTAVHAPDRCTDPMGSLQTSFPASRDHRVHMITVKGIIGTGQAVLGKQGSMGEECICEEKVIAPSRQNTYLTFTEDGGCYKGKVTITKGGGCY